MGRCCPHMGTLLVVVMVRDGFDIDRNEHDASN